MVDLRQSVNMVAIKGQEKLDKDTTEKFEEIKTKIAQAERSFSEEFTTRTNAVKVLESSLEKQKKERKDFEKHMNEQLSSIPTMVEPDAIEFNTGMSVRIENNFISCSQSIRQGQQSLQDQAVQIRTMSNTMFTLGKDMEKERGLLDQLEVEIQASVEMLRKKLEDKMGVIKYSLESKRQKVVDALATVERNVEASCNDIQQEAEYKHQEVEAAIAKLIS